MAGIKATAVLLHDGPLRMWLEDVGCSTTVLESGRFRNVRNTIATVRRLAVFASASDVVVCNQSKGHVYGGLAARIARTPEIWWQHGDPSRSPIELAAAAVPASAVVCSSRAAAIKQLRLTPRRRIEVIHPGICIQEVRDFYSSGLDIRMRAGWSGCRVVGIVGRLQPWKGQDVFLRAASRVATIHSDVRYAVIGGALLGWEGGYPERLEALATDLGIRGSVTFAGHQDEVYAWFDALDIVVHASLDEPFGLVLVEAMALGKPLIATAGAGPSEIIEDGVSGMLVPHGDDARLAIAINELLNDPDRMASMGVAARDRSELFTEERMTNEFRTLIAEVCNIQSEDEQRRRVNLVGFREFVSHRVRIVLGGSRRSGGSWKGYSPPSAQNGLEFGAFGRDIR